MRRTGLVIMSVAAAVLAASVSPAVAAGAPGTPGAPSGAGTAERYLVQVAPGTDAAAAARGAAAAGARVTHVYDLAVRGYAATMTAEQAAGLARDPGVVTVERDQVMTVADTQSSPAWGLDRIDQRALPLSGSYTYDANPGAGVTAYIVDTGVRGTHTDFGGRVATGYGVIGGVAGAGNTDCHGHGTHVAGTVAAATYGVAKAARVTPIRVLACDGTGYVSDIVAGINWAIADHGAGAPAVANMSIGGGASSTLDTAVNNLIKDGVTVAVAAGNSNVDACTTSPARVSAALTVGATGSNDARASFSNYGSCLDVFAPGVSVASTYNTSDTATAVLSGTSMASPHVTGIAAVLLGANPTWTPAQTASALVANATTGVVGSPGTGSPNALAYSPSGVVAAPPPAATAPAAPTVVAAASGSSKGSASVKWTQGANGGSTLTGQTVTVYTGTTKVKTVAVSATAASVMLTGLASKTTYTFGVSATNAVGTSAETLSNAVLTK